jgi:hypothetical protein
MDFMKYIIHKPKLKDLKIWIALFVLITLPFLIRNFLDAENPILLISVFLIIGFFIFNLIIRKSLFFKNYFKNQYNILTSKFKLVDADKENLKF